MLGGAGGGAFGTLGATCEPPRGTLGAAGLGTADLGAGAPTFGAGIDGFGAGAAAFGAGAGGFGAGAAGFGAGAAGLGAGGASLGAGLAGAGLAAGLGDALGAGRDAGGAAGRAGGAGLGAGFAGAAGARFGSSMPAPAAGQPITMTATHAPAAAINLATPDPPLPNLELFIDAAPRAGFPGSPSPNARPPIDTAERSIRSLVRLQTEYKHTLGSHFGGTPLYLAVY